MKAKEDQKQIQDQEKCTYVPKEFTVEELAKAGVIPVNVLQGYMRCEKCGAQWRMMTGSGCQPVFDFHKCPRGCNA